MTTQELVKSLIAMADFFQHHQELAVPYDIAFTSGSPVIHYYGEVSAGLSADSKEGQAAFAKIVGGSIDKTKSDKDYFRLYADRGSFALETCGTRSQVCERVQVGTKIVAAVESRFVPSIPEHEEPVYEWKCPSLLAATDEPSAAGLDAVAEEAQIKIATEIA